MKVTLPELSLILLIGTSGSGKSTFAKKNFQPYEILSSDVCRGLVSNDENSQEATSDAFDILKNIATRRLARGKLTVIDATNLQSEARKPYLDLAREYHCFLVAIIFDIPEKICLEHNQKRTDRQVESRVIRQQRQQLERALKQLKHEKFFKMLTLTSVEEINDFSLERQPLWSNRNQEKGPFDIIGDIHGCADELQELLMDKLGYVACAAPHTLKSAEGRKAIFLGDLVDRGPDTPKVLKLVMNMVTVGSALCVPGNHDIKLLRKLKGESVQVKHGLAESLAQFEKEPPEFKNKVILFLENLVSHYVLDEGHLVVAHAGMKETMQGRASGKVRAFALYGETTGEIDEYGLPVRYPWASEYRGKAMVVYGHTPVSKAEWLNRTINIDTGCVFGGSLTALRYPEKELVSVKARKVYFESIKPFLSESSETATLSTQHSVDDLLSIEEVLGKRFIHTELQKTITIREGHSSVALEVMSRFALNPKWLIYLPPTMSPVETSTQADYLEHPQEAFQYYKKQGITQVICEEKHMGSRMVVVICRDENVSRERFGVLTPNLGVCYTRTGRAFFHDSVLESAFLKELQSTIQRANLWDELKTDWLCLDCELMPWSTKAQELLEKQYAAVGASAKSSLDYTLEVLQKTEQRLEIQSLVEHYQQRAQRIDRYIQTYRGYCWPVRSIQDLKLAPFHLLASESGVHTDQTHLWHLEKIAKLVSASHGLVVDTPYKIIDTQQNESIAEGIHWWESITQKGAEGMVVKPLSFIARGKKGLIQPAVKCRGREYLRIIYGPEYTAPEHLERLRHRSLNVKRNLALREFSLGVEALKRFVQKEPLRRVHECIFGILALESEPLDPRL